MRKYKKSDNSIEARRWRLRNQLVKEMDLTHSVQLGGNDQIIVVMLFPTLTNKLPTILVSFVDGQIVLSDNGMIRGGDYNEDPLVDIDPLSIPSVIIYKEEYDVQAEFKSDGRCYFELICSEEDITVSILDMTCFITGVVNQIYLHKTK